MVCMSAFFTAPFNMYANAGRLRPPRPHSHTRRPIKAAVRARASSQARARALIDGVRGRRQMMGFVIPLSLFRGLVGGLRLRLATAEEI